MIHRFTALLGLTFLAIATAHPVWAQARYAHYGPAVISNVTVIDGLGSQPLRGQDVHTENGKIAAIEPAGSIEAPSGALKIDGSGMSAMPGLIDSSHRSIVD